MDELAHGLARAADEEIRRLLMLIDLQQLHVDSLHPARRGADLRKLNEMKIKYARLLNYRHALAS